MIAKRRVLRCCALTVLLALLFTLQSFAAMPEYLIPGGNTVGLQLYAKGLLITSVLEDSPAQRAGLRSGDQITKADGLELRSAQMLRELTQEEQALVLTVERSGKEAQYLLTPAKSEQGPSLGLCVRDHIAGIGTVTYYDPDTAAYGALGHGVGGFSGQELLPLSDGFAVSAKVASVEKGSSGQPGALKGSFDCSHAIGSVTQNRPQGVFGVMRDLPQKAALPVGSKDSAHVGSAEILANVSGSTVEAYTVQIERIYSSVGNGRNLLLRVTDLRLLEQTGGIVQGMSGSPIIQDGRMIGAVTHVLVNNPTRGYGIFIENMLNAAEKLTEKESTVDLVGKPGH